MKKISICYIFLVIYIMLLIGCTPQYDEQQKNNPKILAKDLGSPFDSCYDDSTAKTPWDMIVFDNKLFIGSGNCEENLGPCNIACYDLITNELYLSTVPDEQISIFTIMNGKLIAPGIDPMYDWSLGNYYVYGNRGWETYRNIPYGIHTYQIIEYKGEIFAALGSVEGHYPSVISRDGGISFNEIKFVKNGQAYPVCNSLSDRVYNMFVLDKKLYAIRFSSGKYEVFVYSNEEFQYVTQWMYDIIIPNTEPFQQKSDFSASITHNNAYYFSTGYLFRTKDAKNIEYIAFDDNRLVIDLYENNGILYALAIKENLDGSYTSSIYQITENNNMLVFEVIESSHAVSLAVENNKFYLGFGYNKSESNKSYKIKEYQYKGEIQ